MQDPLGSQGGKGAGCSTRKSEKSWVLQDHTITNTGTAPEQSQYSSHLTTTNQVQGQYRKQQDSSKLCCSLHSSGSE